jgi:hypothetical protein
MIADNKTGAYALNDENSMLGVGDIDTTIPREGCRAGNNIINVSA